MLLNLSIDTTALEQLYSQRIEDIKQSSDKKKKLAITNATRHKEEILQLTEAKDLLDAQSTVYKRKGVSPFCTTVPESIVKLWLMNKDSLMLR